MFRVTAVVAAVVLVAVVPAQMFRVSADEKMSMKSIMKDGHKGEEAPIQTILAGKADEKLLKQFLAYYEFMSTQKPPQGDEASWKKKTAALVEATQGLIAKKDGSLGALKSAVNCKACHTDHKPKKQ